MDNDKIFALVLDIKKEQLQIKESQFRMEADLKEHMRRSDAAEKMVEILDGRLSNLEKPAQAQAYLLRFVVNAGKVLGVVGAALAILSYTGKI